MKVPRPFDLDAIEERTVALNFDDSIETDTVMCARDDALALISALRERNAQLETAYAVMRELREDVYAKEDRINEWDKALRSERARVAELEASVRDLTTCRLCGVVGANAPKDCQYLALTRCLANDRMQDGSQ